MGHKGPINCCIGTLRSTTQRESINHQSHCSGVECLVLQNETETYI